KKLSRINHPQSQGKRMMAHRYIVLASLLMAVLQACGSGNSEEIVTLQKQVAALTHQVEETRRQVESMQEADQKLNKSLESLETELDHLKVSETSPPAPAAKPGGEKGRVRLFQGGRPYGVLSLSEGGAGLLRLAT